MLKSVIPAIAAVLSMSLAAPLPANAESTAMSRHSAGQPPRLGPAEISALRGPRVRHETLHRQRSSAKVPGSRSGDTAWLAPRMAEEQQPDSDRSPVHVNPHATDPATPHQVPARSRPLDVRAPAIPTAQRSTPLRVPRMKVSRETRASRASFEDWLFGR
ncbi:MAG: hypothetical protein QNJ62_08300 [Methyloceanibacter sp.]|nr:hypothetical protein [Methyloceanibacter sp.]